MRHWWHDLFRDHHRRWNAERHAGQRCVPGVKWPRSSNARCTRTQKGEITRGLFTQHLTDFDGRYYHLKEARLDPKPVQKPYPPFVIGGGGEKLTLRIVAQFADIWNSTTADPAAFQHKVRVLHEHCAEIGRDPREIELSSQTRFDANNLPALVDVGATYLILMLDDPFPDGIVDRLANDVVAKIV